jgi:hypothetical protein
MMSSLRLMHRMILKSVTEPVAKPTGVEVGPANNAPQETYFDDGPGQQDEVLPPIQIPTTLSEDSALPSQGMTVCNARVRVRKLPKKYVPSMKGNKYAVAMTQIAASLKDSKHAMAMAQMSVKLMSPGVHRQANIVGMIMVQPSMKAAIKKWGDEAKFAISKEMKQLHWHNLYKTRHWHALTKKQKEQVLESHIFVEEKSKAQKVIGGNKQCDYITKEDVSSPTVIAEAVMLTCVIDAQ